MVFNYARIAKVANRMLRKFGGTFSYTVVIKGEYDPATRTQTGSETVTQVTGVFVGPGKTFIDGTVVQRGDARFLLGTKSIVPRQGDKITASGLTYFVQAARTVDPSGSKPCIYVLELKAG
jgi:hypothetical protein